MPAPLWLVSRGVEAAAGVRLVEIVTDKATPYPVVLGTCYRGPGIAPAGTRRVRKLRRSL